MSDNADTQKMLELLTDIARSTRFMAMRAAREVALQALQKDSEKLAYHYSDGRASTEVAKLSGTSDFTIRSYWRKWNSMGLVSPSPKFKGRFERVFSLDDFGMDLPTAKVTSGLDSPKESADTGNEKLDSGVKISEPK